MRRASSVNVNVKPLLWNSSGFSNRILNLSCASQFFSVNRFDELPISPSPLLFVTFQAKTSTQTFLPGKTPGFARKFTGIYREVYRDSPGSSPGSSPGCTGKFPGI